MAASGEEKRQTPTTSTFPDEQLNLIERKKLLKLAEELYSSTHFTLQETEQLLLLYRSLAGNSRMDRVTLRDLLHDRFHMSDDFFMDRVFREFDSDSDSYLSQEEFVNGMSIFLRGTLDELMEYTFNIYDLNGDGYISREEMFQMLKSSMIRIPTEEDPDEGIKDLVEIMVKKMDHDSDQKVSLEDFKTTVRNEPLLIEAFGPSLPTREDMEHFSLLVFNH